MKEEFNIFIKRGSWKCISRDKVKKIKIKNKDKKYLRLKKNLMEVKYIKQDM